MDYFTKWPKVYAIPCQETSTVADAFVTNFICRFGVLRELHSNQGRNLVFRLRSWNVLRISKTRTTTLHPQSDGTVDRYVKTVEEHMRKMVSTYERDWDKRLPSFF
jgi:hypothetical protein